jgi:hypothetical protein
MPWKCAVFCASPVVNISSRPNAQNAYCSRCVLADEQDTTIADAQPELRTAGELYHSGRIVGILDESVDRIQYPLD